MTPTTPRIVRIAQVELQMGPDGTAGTLARVTYKWRKDFRLARMFFSYVNWAGPTWTDAIAAKVQVQIQNQNSWYLTTDGQNPVYVPSLALMGASRRWFPLGAVVRGGDIWTIDLKSTVDVVPILLFDVEEVASAAA